MNFYLFLTIFVFLIGFISINSAYAQIDPLSDIEFLQTGQINTANNQFQISNDIDIREFTYGNIVRVSGQTLEGFPYIIYSKILDDQINTRGMIFIGGKFVDLNFDRTIVEESKTTEEKNEDISILVQYSQRVYEKRFAQIDLKIYEKSQNKLNDFNLNYGYLSDVNIDILIIDEQNQEVLSVNGTTNEKGFFETEFYIPEKSRETFTVTITAEDEDSKTSKILQIFSLGEVSDGKSSKSP